MGLHRPPKGTAGALIRFGGEGYAAAARRWVALMRITVVMIPHDPIRQVWPEWVCPASHFRTLAYLATMKAAARGKITRTSANSPGRVSTSIDPECCFTIMS